MKKLHHPPHIYLDEYMYFITVSTFNRQKIFKSDKNKQLMLDSLKAGVRRSGYDLYAWVILDNHYHILIKVRDSKRLSMMMNLLHGRVSYNLNKLENCRGRKIFQNYWDRCIRDERDFWIHFNYIHHNPVKHRHVNDSKNYPFSSYNHWLNEKGEEWLGSCFAEYPIRDYTPAVVEKGGVEK